ncbi:MAG: PTS sugar transporter subunit IIA [Candidatus Brocadiae bacterium]|nr:PTS sugar transporter subunit IIA [Candidatus Brocadiia bacterium]
MNFIQYLSEKSIDLNMDFSEYVLEVPEEEEPEVAKNLSRRETKRIKAKEEKPKVSVNEKENKRILIEGVLQKTADLLYASEKITSCAKLSNLLVLNHGKASSAIGNGIAIPHVRSLQSKDLVMSFGICRDGIDFDAPDQEKVYIFIGMTAPNYNDALYLKIYKSIAGALLQTDVKEQWMAAEEKGEIIRIFNKYLI